MSKTLAEFEVMPMLLDGQLLRVVSGQHAGSTGRYRPGQHPNVPKMVRVDFMRDSTCKVELKKHGKKVHLEREQTLWFGKGQLTVVEKGGSQ